MSEEALIREVDDEVRAEEYQKLWKKYGNVFVAIAVLVVLGVGGYQAWQYYQRQQSEAAAVVYFDAVKKMKDGKFDDALAALQAVKTPGFGQLAKLQEASVLAQKGDIEKAVAAYDAFAANPANDPAFADLARIRAGYLLVDSSTPDQLLSRLGQYDKDGQIWRHQAREIFGLAAWRSGDMTMADRYFNAIFADPETPDAMRQRAQVMIQLITPALPEK